MPFTLRNLEEDLEDVGSNFDGAPDLEFRHASKALELEQSGLSYQRIPPENRSVAGATTGTGAVVSVPDRAWTDWPEPRARGRKPPSAAPIREKKKLLRSKPPWSWGVEGDATADG